MNNICVCGGGNIGHAAAAYLSLSKDNSVSVHTRNPEKWNSLLTITLPDNSQSTGNAIKVSNNPAEIITSANILLITLPKNIISEYLSSIEPFLRDSQCLVFLPGGAGINWIIKSLTTKNISYIALQRVPFISRIITYGKSVHITGIKSQLKIACSQKLKNKGVVLIENLFNINTKLIPNFLSITLNNSNPLLHPSRLYSLFNNYSDDIEYPRNYLFYEEWDDFASSLYIAADHELQLICNSIPLDLTEVVSVTDYYEVTNIMDLTNKIESIPAFKNISSPMINTINKTWIPDLTSRYFLEDIPFGTIPIKAIAEIMNIKTPIIDTFILWYQKLLHKEILNKDGSFNKNLDKDVLVPQQHGITTLEDIIEVENYMR